MIFWMLMFFYYFAETYPITILTGLFLPTFQNFLYFSYCEHFSTCSFVPAHLFLISS